MGIIESAVETVLPAPVGIPLRILGGVKEAGSWLAANPLVTLALAMSAFGAVEHHEAAKWHRVADQRAVTIAALPAAQEAALAQQRALDAGIAAQYQAQAEKSDANYKTVLAGAGAAADRYIADHRVRPGAAADRAGSAGGAAQTGVPGIPADLPGDGVVVSASDVQACTDADSYAVSAHNAAVDAVAAGLGDFAAP